MSRDEPSRERPAKSQAVSWPNITLTPVKHKHQRGSVSNTGRISRKNRAKKLRFVVETNNNSRRGMSLGFFLPVFGPRRALFIVGYKTLAIFGVAIKHTRV